MHIFVVVIVSFLFYFCCCLVFSNVCKVSPEGSLELSDFFPLSGKSGLSFDSPFLSHLVFLPSPLALFVL